MLKIKNTILNVIVAVAMLITLMFGLAACGSDNKIKDSDVVGYWGVTKIEYTPNADNTNSPKAATCTKAEWEAGVDGDVFDIFEDAFYNYEFTSEYKVKKVFCGEKYDEHVTWKIEKGKIVIPEEWNSSTIASVEFENKKVIITCEESENSGLYGTMVYTLEKVSDVLLIDNVVGAYTVVEAKVVVDPENDPVTVECTKEEYTTISNMDIAQRTDDEALIMNWCDGMFVEFTFNENGTIDQTTNDYEGWANWGIEQINKLTFNNASWNDCEAKCQNDKIYLTASIDGEIYPTVYTWVLKKVVAD